MQTCNEVGKTCMVFVPSTGPLNAIRYAEARRDGSRCRHQRCRELSFRSWRWCQVWMRSASSGVRLCRHSQRGMLAPVDIALGVKLLPQLIKAACMGRAVLTQSGDVCPNLEQLGPDNATPVFYELHAA
jgi:hypothetical protein